MFNNNDQTRGQIESVLMGRKTVTIEKYIPVNVRERFTHILAKLASHNENETSIEKQKEYNALRSEMNRLIREHPEWQDIAKQWIPNL